MSSTVHLSDEAYALLLALKGPNESFSDVVVRELGRGRKPLKLLELGRYLDPATDLEETRRQRRKSETERDEDLERRWTGEAS